MAANALVQTRIDREVKDKAAVVLQELGITVSDAVRMLLTRTANEGVLPFTLANTAEAHDLWFRAKVQEALDDKRPAVPHEEVTREFGALKAALREKIRSGKSKNAA